MQTSDIRLRDSIGFHLGMTYRKLTNLLHNKLKLYDITPEQWVVLYQIEDANGAAQKDIAERAGKDRPTTTRILNQLESKGLVIKQTSEYDRRSFSVYITTKGSQILLKTVPIERQLIEEVKKCMSEQEYKQFMQLLYRLDEHILDITQLESRGHYAP